MSTSHQQRMVRARLSLDGLSIGDAFGQGFFGTPDATEASIEARRLPGAPWHFTDDTVMALACVEILEEQGGIDQDLLAARFVEKYRQDPSRGYGGTARSILVRMEKGCPWREASRAAFGGSGSMGNGGAMRAGPIGAYFSDDLAAAALNARFSAEVTHFHPEGQAGAIAVSLAAAWAAGKGPASEFFGTVLQHLPESETKEMIARAASLPLSYEVRTAVAALGNGSRLLSQDTVPFALWCVAQHPENYEEALWSAVSGLGDRDTTCAIVGSIAAFIQDGTSIPEQWRKAREPLSVMARQVRAE